MAVPPSITVNNLSGAYTINRTLSDPSHSILKQQSVGWMIRQAVAYSTVTVTLHQYDAPGTADSDISLPHLDQYQNSTGGIRNFEDRIMDWEWTDKENWIWGKVHGRSRYVKLSEISDSWLREGWENPQGQVVEGFVESLKDGWSAWQVWGFTQVEGQRQHVRKILGRRKGWKDEKVRMVYDWKGPAEIPAQTQT